MQDSEWDVIIIGAGPAGSTAAYLLAKKNFKVLMLDKKTFPRPKLCAGLITKKTVHLIHQIFETDIESLISDNIVRSRSRDYSICFRDKKLVHGRLDDPFHIVERSTYDHLWLMKAAESGVIVKTPCFVESMDFETGTIQTGTKTRYRAKYIIGADGAFSCIRSALQSQGMISNPIPDAAMALETVIVSNSASRLPPHPSIFFGFIHRGYAWCFPKGDRHILGICGPKKTSPPGLKRRLEQFLDTLQIESTDCKRILGHPLPYGNYMQTPGAGNVLLIGDAAGFADPILGEGIFYAHSSAVLAAQAIVTAEKKGMPADRLYFEALRPSILKEMKYAHIYQKGLHSFLSVKGFRPFELGMKLFRKIIEETIQGDRSFAWFRRNKHQIGDNL